jgi:vacuolar-type H+-ATPase subunit I/STV1
MAIQSREPVSREELEALAQWGGVLVTASDSFSQKRQQLREQANRERSELNRKFREMEENLTEEERLALSKVAKDSDRQGIFDLLNESGYDARRVNYAAGELRRYLEQEGGFSRSEINHIIQLLRTYPPSSAR